MGTLAERVKRAPKRKIVKIAAMTIGITIIVLAVAGLMGYPLIISEVDGNIRFFISSPFWRICDEIRDLTGSLLEPLDTPPPMRYFGFDDEAYRRELHKETVRYLLNKDFTEELDTFEELLQKARQEFLKKEKKVAKNPRWRSVSSLLEWYTQLTRMEGALTDIKLGIEAARKYEGIENPDITDEDRLLFLALRRWNRR
jgi:hypothetical protein